MTTPEDLLRILADSESFEKYRQDQIKEIQESMAALRKTIEVLHNSGLKLQNVCLALNTVTTVGIRSVSDPFVRQILLNDLVDGLRERGLL